MNLFIFLTATIIWTIASYSLFLRSFIAPKKIISGKYNHDNFASTLNSSHYNVFDLSTSNELSSAYMTISNQQLYKRNVVIVIDALRVDFLGGQHMPFLQSRLDAGDGSLSFVARVQPPTVTLPRIKAITTGTIPGFVDVVLNFGSSALVEDNVITQAKDHGKQMVFYGDDTWLSLFPDHFLRFDGTSSFYVNDFTEVDNNVTRHLQQELAKQDWDLMILHYLGLDHIGHTHGPFSQLIGPKLMEMDQVIKQIFGELEKSSSPSLILVCGDHGMSDQGGHGGATESEVKVPVLLLQTQQGTSYNHGTASQKEIDQIDIAPTLSVLLGLPIPNNNLGTLISDALPGYNTDDILVLLVANGLQVSEVLRHNVLTYESDKGYELFMRTLTAYSLWLNDTKSSHEEQGNKLIQQFQAAIKLMSSKMSISVTQYDMYGLVVSILSLWMILLVLVISYRNPEDPSLGSVTVVCMFIAAFIHMVICTSSSQGSELMCDTHASSMALQLFMIGMLALYSSKIIDGVMCSGQAINTRTTGLYKLGLLPFFLVAGTVVHTVSLLSSSFVEEEHQTWYFFTVTSHIIILYVMVVARSRTQDRKIETENGFYSEKIFARESGSHTSTTRNGCHENDDYKEIQLLHTKMYNSQNLKRGHKTETNDQTDETSIPSVKHFAMVVVVLALCRFMRCWNQTGNKWLNVPDLGDWLTRPENTFFLSVLVGISLLVVFLCKMMTMSILQQTIYGSGLLCVYLQKSASGSLISITVHSDKNGCLEGQIVYICALLYLIIACCKRLFQGSPESNNLAANIHITFTLVFLVLSRPHNIVLVSMMVAQEVLLADYILPLIDMTPVCSLYFLWMGQASFFYQGNSNSISTVDVSAGYIGLHDYQPVIVGLLLAVSTYGGIIFWMLSFFRFIIKMSMKSKETNRNDCTKRLRQTITDSVHSLCLSRALPLAVYTVLVTLMRYHLFVWTVFSPKLLYEGMLTVVLSVISISFLVCNIFL